MAGIPIHCYSCGLTWTPVGIAGEGTATLKNVHFGCPRCGAVTDGSGTYTVKDGVVRAVGVLSTLRAERAALIAAAPALVAQGQASLALEDQVRALAPEFSAWLARIQPHLRQAVLFLLVQALVIFASTEYQQRASPSASPAEVRKIVREENAAFEKRVLDGVDRMMREQPEAKPPPKVRPKPRPKAAGKSHGRGKKRRR